MSLKAKHLITNHKKKWILILSFILIFVVAVSAVFAYMVASTNEKNEFELTKAAVTLQPIVSKDANDIPTNIVVKNVGQADARIRVQIIPMYRNISNGSIYWQSPVRDKDFTVEYSDLWVPLGTAEHNASYYTYYYDALLAVGQASTDMLKGNGIRQLTTPPEGFALYFDILVDGVQHVPNDDPAGDAWGVRY